MKVYMININAYINHINLDNTGYLRLQRLRACKAWPNH